MAADMKRFTISITPEMEKELDRIKQTYYYKDTRNKMIQGLIICGLKSMKEEKASAKK